MKNGLFEEGENLIYYRNDNPYHAGVVKIGDDIYYISGGGKAVKGPHVIYHDMTNGILKRGTYTFGDDCKLIPNSYIPPVKVNDSNKKHNFFGDILRPGLTVLLPILLIALLIQTFGRKKAVDVPLPPENTEYNEDEEYLGLEMILPKFDDPVLLCSTSAKSVYDSEITVSQSIGSNPYKPFKFEYKHLPQDSILSISEYPDLHDAREYTLPEKSESVLIENLKTGTKYYYSVDVGEHTYNGSFKTDKSTRFVNLPGVKNTRDIGGYTTLDGKKVKQGMLIRGTEIDGLVEPTYFLEKDAIAAVQETFGFVCDLDLRAADLINGNYQTRLGKDVTHKFYSSPMYGSIFSADYQPALKQIFTDLANPQNYPMYLHCTYGADRTGTICFLLEGILNLPEEVMQRDYQLTGYFSSGYASSSSFNSIYGGVEGYAGDTIQEKIVNYLTSRQVGVTKDEIDSIRRIFLEDNAEQPQ